LEEPLGLPTGRFALGTTLPALADLGDFAGEALAFAVLATTFWAALALGAGFATALTGFLTDLAAVPLTAFLAAPTFFAAVLGAALAASLAAEFFLVFRAVSLTALVAGLPLPLEAEAAATLEARLELALAADLGPAFTGFLAAAFVSESSITAWAAASRAMGTL